MAFCLQLSGLPAEADANLYSYLCLDGHLQPLNSSAPCVWVAQPWAAIAAKREHASTVQLLLEHLDHTDVNSWQSALLNILETYHVNIKQLDNTIPINDYLEQAVGFTSAYSFPSCNPPRAIVYCTSSLIEHTKCSWLQEVAEVYGIEPTLQCIREMSYDACLANVQHRIADVVFVDEKDRMRAETAYSLKPLLYEYAKQKSDRYTIVAVVKIGSDIYNFDDLFKKRACLPSYEGAAYLSVLETIRHVRRANNDEPYSADEVSAYFAKDSCTWAPNSAHCKAAYSGDEGALNCLKENRGDVAFVDMAAFQQFIGMTRGANSTKQSIKSTEYKLICPFGRNAIPDELCYLHWTSRATLMINNQTKTVRKNEIYNSLRYMDRLFGKYYESHVLPFAMFGPFDRKNDVMFHDRTEALRGIVEMQKDRAPRFLETTQRAFFKSMQAQKLTSAATIQRLDLMYMFIGVFMFAHCVLTNHWGQMIKISILITRHSRMNQSVCDKEQRNGMLSRYTKAKAN